MHDVAKFQRSALAGPLERLPAEDPMILLPLMLIWLRAPMHFTPPVRWAVVGWAICIAAAGAVAEGKPPQRGWEPHAVDGAGLGGAGEITRLTSEPPALAPPSGEPRPRQTLRPGATRNSPLGSKESQKNRSRGGNPCARIPAAKGAAEAAMLALRPASLAAPAPQRLAPPGVCLVRLVSGN